MGEIRRLTKFASKYEALFAQAVMDCFQQNAATEREAMQKEVYTITPSKPGTERWTIYLSESTKIYDVKGGKNNPTQIHHCCDGSFVVKKAAVMRKGVKTSVIASISARKELFFMSSLFERMGGTYRREGDYFIPNIELPDTGTAPLGKYGRMRRRYLQEYRPGLYSRLAASGKLSEHLTEIDQTCHGASAPLWRRGRA